MIWLARWWTLRMTSEMPKVRRRVRVISRRVRPLISTRALGRLSVSGRRRVPRPAARIMAFIGKPSLVHFLEFEVAEDNFEAGAGAEALG